MANTHLCECGCGLPTNPKSRFRRGHNIGVGGMSPYERFCHFADIRASNDCWEWKHTIGKSGYGQLRLYGRMTQAHRLSYEIHFGAIPDGMLVCHHCDNRRCVNPNHLFLGTHQDNAMDMVDKGRHARYAHSGEDNPTAILTEDKVREIRRLREQGETQKSIANRFGLCRSHVGDIVNRVIWKHV